LFPKINFRSAANAFYTTLLESEKQAKFRGHVAEKMVTDIADVIKKFNQEKSLTGKKLIDYEVSI